MADISQEELKKEITAILKDADLSALSGKKVRQQIEEKLDIDLSARRKEVDELVMDCLQEKKDKSKKKNGSAKDKSDDEEDDDEEEDEEEDDEEEEEEEKPKRAAKKPAPKRKKASSDESDDGSDEDKDDDYSPKKKTKGGKKPAKKAAARKSKGGSESDSDEDWGKKKKAAAAKKGGGAAKGGGGGYTKAIKLSPELSELMGEEAMPRHEVVKRIWALIKEKNLYDPKNKQFAICNDELFKVFGVKRFRTFGMMKLLKDHFVS